jgi:uncharacterized membrane protein
VAVARAALLVALAIWIGAVVFFSFVIAPAAFSALPRETAGAFLATVFPRYYALGIACGIVALTAAMLLRVSLPTRRATIVAAVVALMLVATSLAAFVIQPRAHALREEARAAPDSDAKRTFDRLHRQAVWLNATVLLLGLGTIVVIATDDTRS